MINVRPDFYDGFRCIASACTDNCCIGWEIDIDDDTVKKYSIPGIPFADEIKSSITVSSDGSTCFKLAPGERCVHLDENNLCRIIKNCGEDMLCEICREHPRFYNCFDGVTEAGLGLCCEEVCRLLFAKKDGFTLIFEDDGQKDFESESEKELYLALCRIRNEFSDILFRKNTEYNKKAAAVREAAARYDREIFENTTECCAKLGDGELIKLMKETEAIDENWCALTEKAEKYIPFFDKAEKAYDEQYGGDDCALVSAYTLYRHFIKAFDDGEILAHTDFCLNFTRFYKLMNILTFRENGAVTDSDRINNLKYLSKQIEYSEENTDMLTFTGSD